MLLMAAACWPCDAQAQTIRRCTAADGSTVMTDKPCAAIGAAERLPRQAGALASAQPNRGGCARDIEALSFAVAAAFDLQDANRLAALYHWPGMDNTNAYRVMDRLDALVKRQLVDIGPVGGGFDEEPRWVEDAEGNLVPAPARRRPVTGLRIVQSAGRDGQTSQTVFGLRRHLGCLWISL